MTTETNENILLSIKDHLVTKLTDYGYIGVFFIEDMRDVADGTVTLPTDKRYVFLVSTFQKPTVTTLPFVVLEIQSLDREPYELGNDSDARTFDTFIHVFARSQSERNQLSSYLQSTSGIGRSITYNDYSSGSAVEQAHPIQRTGGIMVTNAPPIRDEQIQEYSLANWSIVSFSARTIL